jgi:hypothetical protein
MADDVSFGATFLPTRHTYPMGTMIELRIPTVPQGGHAGARSRRWSAGAIGAALGARRLEFWIDTVLAPDSISA